MAPEIGPPRAHSQLPLGTGSKVKLDWTNGSRSAAAAVLQNCDGEVALWVQALAVKSEDLSSIPGENLLPQVVFDRLTHSAGHTGTQHTHARVHTLTIKFA